MRGARISEMNGVLSIWRSPLDKVALVKAEAFANRQPRCSILFRAGQFHLDRPIGRREVRYMFQNFDFRRGLTGACLVAMLAGCGVSSLSAPPPSTGAVSQARLHQPTRRSWMDTMASSQALLYVADGEDVHVYTYPQGRLVGTLTGFIGLGECVDPTGDVFIVSATSDSGGTGIIYEYAHGGVQPIATLDDPTPAFGCAVDPSSGDLAVAGKYSSGSYFYGDVAVYANAQGNPSMYYSSTFLPFVLCGYDPKGNLYLSTETQYLNQDQLVRLAAASSNFEEISLNVKLYDEGAAPSVQWDGKYMTASSAPYREPTYLYRLHITGDSATVVGTTTLSSKKNVMKSGQIWIQDNHVLGADFFKGKGGVDSWSYPNAGEPRSVVPNKADLVPFGLAVSRAVAQ
jgi:hypothetical protein